VVNREYDETMTLRAGGRRCTSGSLPPADLGPAPEPVLIHGAGFSMQISKKRFLLPLVEERLEPRVAGTADRKARSIRENCNPALLPRLDAHNALRFTI